MSLYIKLIIIFNIQNIYMAERMETASTSETGSVTGSDSVLDTGSVTGSETPTPIQIVVSYNAENKNFTIKENDNKSIPFNFVVPVLGEKEKGNLSALNINDIYKDAYNVSPPTTKVTKEEILNKSIQRLFALDNTPLKTGWEAKLHAITQKEAIPPETEIVFERYKVKRDRLPCTIYFNESGLKASNVAQNTDKTMHNVDGGTSNRCWSR